jgi:imidazolonepropionase-like amidohydrolase
VQPRATAVKDSDMGARRLILRPRLIIDGISDSPREHGQVVIAAGMIAVVQDVPAGPVATDEAVPASETILELPDATVLPGLIDCHVHYTIDPSTDIDGIAQGAANPPERAVLIGARNAREALAAGVTTARSAGASRGLDIPLAAAIDHGDIEGPKLLPAGPAITITGGHGRSFGVEVDSAQDMVAAVRQLARDGARVVKLVASEAAMLTTDIAGVQELTSAEMSAVVGEAKRLRRRVLAHAQSSAAVAAAAEAGVDSVEHAFLADSDALRLLRESGAVLTPTLTVTDVYSRMPGLPPDVVRRQAEISVLHRASCERAIELGIPVVTGTDCGVRGVFPSMLAREIELLHEHGLSPMDAIRAATVNGASLLGISQEVGTLAAGLRADIIVVAGDPLANLRRLAEPVLVIRGGDIAYRRCGLDICRGNNFNVAYQSDLG